MWAQTPASSVGANPVVAGRNGASTCRASHHLGLRPRLLCGPQQPSCLLWHSPQATVAGDSWVWVRCSSTFSTFFFFAGKCISSLCLSGKSRLFLQLHGKVFITLIYYFILSHRYPTNAEYVQVVQTLIAKYPFLKDLEGNGYVS